MNSNINLKDLTQLELFDLRQKVNDELTDYSNREKKKAFAIKQTFQDTRYFSKKPQAHAAVIEMIDDDALFDDNAVECLIVYLSTEEWKQLCEDQS